MKGPDILARTMSAPMGRGWQYNSRSDHHSKVACWTVLFDLLLECDALRSAAGARRIGFGINRNMVGPINKKLDLVVTTPQSNRAVVKRARLAALDQPAPGAFAHVKRQVDILGEAFEADELPSQLESKHCVNPEARQQWAIGFVRR
jgi:hypothetical protein